MGNYQQNHREIENAVQAKLGDLNLRLVEGTIAERLIAWGTYLEKYKTQRLKLKEHEGIYYLGKEARMKGMTEDDIDNHIKRGRHEYSRAVPLTERQEVTWKD